MSSPLLAHSIAMKNTKWYTLEQEDRILTLRKQENMATGEGNATSGVWTEYVGCKETFPVFLWQLSAPLLIGAHSVAMKNTWNTPMPHKWLTDAGNATSRMWTQKDGKRCFLFLRLVSCWSIHSGYMKNMTHCWTAVKPESFFVPFVVAFQHLEVYRHY